MILRAQLQQVAEIDYKSLVEITKEGMALLQRCQAGEVVDGEWIRRRDEIVERARQYILDE